MSKKKYRLFQVTDSSNLFKKADGTVINDLRSYIKDWVDKNPNSEIFVGCDSQDRTHKTKYATVIAMYNIGKGAHVITSTFMVNTKLDRMTRLWEEVEKSIKVAKDIKEYVNVPISVHFDFNSEKDQVSNQLYDAAKGYTKSFGFDGYGKPESPAASYAADKQCRK